MIPEYDLYFILEKNSYLGTPEAPFFLQCYSPTFLCKSKKWVNSTLLLSVPPFRTKKQDESTPEKLHSLVPAGVGFLILMSFASFPWKPSSCLVFLQIITRVLPKEKVRWLRALPEKGVFLRGKHRRAVVENVWGQFTVQVRCFKPQISWGVRCSLETWVWTTHLRCSPLLMSRATRRKPSPCGRKPW